MILRGATTRQPGRHSQDRPIQIHLLSASMVSDSLLLERRKKSYQNFAPWDRNLGTPSSFTHDAYIPRLFFNHSSRFPRCPSFSENRLSHFHLDPKLSPPFICKTMHFQLLPARPLQLLCLICLLTGTIAQDLSQLPSCAVWPVFLFWMETPGD